MGSTMQLRVLHMSFSICKASCTCPFPIHHTVPPPMGVTAGYSEHCFSCGYFRSNLILHYPYQFHKQSVFLASLVLAAPIYSLLHIRLRWFPDRADNEYLAPPPYDPPRLRSVTETSSSCHSKNLFSVSVICFMYLYYHWHITATHAHR